MDNCIIIEKGVIYDEIFFNLGVNLIVMVEDLLNGKE